MEAKREENMKRDKPIPSTSYLSVAKQENPCLPLASLQLLKQYESKLKRFSLEKPRDQSSNSSSSTSDSDQVLSTDAIIKMAKAGLRQCKFQNSELIPILRNEFLDNCVGRSSERSEDFELAQLFQVSVLKYSNGQVNRARQLLRFCEDSAPVNGNPVQRVVHYFAEALQERINREMGTFPSEAPQQNQVRHRYMDEVLTNPVSAIIQCQQESPISHVAHFTAIQTIMEHVASAKRVHLVDLGIRSGSHWSVMMQALADRHECPLELLKISAVGPSKEMIEEMGKMLTSFAKTMNVPFTFKLVLSNIKNLQEDMFELGAGEAVVVYSDYLMASLLPWPDRLESAVVTIKKLNPCLMVVCELEACTNSPAFMDRFDEALSLYSAYFDCLEDCMGRDNPFRAILEEKFIREGIRNTIAAEGEERVLRHERIDFWRSFFERFGIVEIPLSDSALYQAKLVSKRKACWSSCTLDTDGKSLIIGWKGTPLKFLSAWKF